MDSGVAVQLLTLPRLESNGSSGRSLRETVSQSLIYPIGSKCLTISKHASEKPCDYNWLKKMVGKRLRQHQKSTWCFMDSKKHPEGVKLLFC